MQSYRRNLIAGGTYFFTVNLLDRSSRLLVNEIATLRASVAAAHDAYHSALTPGSSYPTTCTVSGRYHPTTPTILPAGA